VRDLTLGGAVWACTQLTATDSQTPANGSSKSTDQPKVTYWGVAPRIGYVAPLAMLVISPWNHFGPTLDVAISGKSTSASATGTGTTGTATPTSIDSAMFQIGVSAGMLGHF
jgi:hypothetical protein